MPINTTITEKATIPSQYQAYFELDPNLVKKMGTLSIDLIVFETGLAESRLSVQNKQLVHQLRRIGQNEQEKKVNEKVDNYHRYGNLASSCLAGCLSVASAFAGPASAIGVGLQAVGGVVQATGGHFDKKADGQLSGIDHVYQIKGSIIGEYSQDMQKSDRGFDQGQSLIERVQQSQQRTWEAVASAA
ncbi:hypothetical protein [Candidatus Protochlamydia phocaeensis]|uniref:hypothetical protein n=1 Tax=Candidatus Protochlamydia phocaeensis TaxID=1414722 RepID=UPI0008383285|nr:hypothetical protein [Candidatus Protochlamydia phocaeensis]